MVDRKINCIVNLSGGFECLAALWYAKEKGFNPVCLHLYNPNAKGKFAQAELSAAQKQADYFKVDLIVDESTIPQESNKNNYPVLQHQSAIAQLIQGNPRTKFKYIIWGANADDSFRQRLQLRYPFRAMKAGISRQLDLHGLESKEFLKTPINLFPFEWLSKSEVVAIIHRANKELLDLVWTCSGEFENDTPCGKCTKCLEWKYARHVAWKSQLKQQEGYVWSI